MPTYEYECVNGHRHDRVKRIKDRNRPERCPECGEMAGLAVSLPQRPLNTGTPMHHG